MQERIHLSIPVTRRSLLATVAAAGAGAATGVLFPEILRRRPRRNVILIVADALRADNLSRRRPVLGAPGSITPFLDGLAASGVRFERAFAPSSWTPVSMGAILYDTSPFNVCYTPDGLAVDSSCGPLAARLRQLGCLTASVNSNSVIDTPVIRAGFDEFAAIGGDPSDQRNPLGGIKRDRSYAAPAVNRRVERLIDKLERSSSFFLYLHYMDTHEPYFCPGPSLAALGARFEQEITVWRVRRQFLAGETDYRWATAEMPIGEAISRLRDHYDAATLELDGALRRLFSMLDRRRLLDGTLIIVTADHGEEFADNTETSPTLGHAQNLSLPEIAVPLVAWRRGPRGALAAAGDLSRPVSSSAVINDMIARHTGLPRRAGTGEPVVSYLNFRGYNGISVVSGNLKMNAMFDKSGALQADLARAFAFARSGGLREAAVGAHMRDLLVRAGRSGRAALAEDSIDEKTRDRLRALGYLN